MLVAQTVDTAGRTYDATYSVDIIHPQLFLWGCIQPSFVLVQLD